ATDKVAMIAIPAMMINAVWGVRSLAIYDDLGLSAAPVVGMSGIVSNLSRLHHAGEARDRQQAESPSQDGLEIEIIDGEHAPGLRRIRAPIFGLTYLDDRQDRIERVHPRIEDRVARCLPLFAEAGELGLAGIRSPVHELLGRGE